MDNLINYQDDLMYRISKARANFKKTPKDRWSREYVDGRLESLDHLWFEFLAGHKELYKNYSSIELKTTSYVKNDTYEKCEEVYLDYKMELKVKLSVYSTPSTSNVGESVKFKQNVKLPKLNIESFSGRSYAEWTTFRDLFVSLIHNNNDLDDIQKLLYLKGYLTDEAKQLLSNIPIINDNYARAWHLLRDRYDNKKYVANHILERLLNQRTMTQESASYLKSILDTTNDCLAALGNIGIETLNWDILIIHIIVKKLDPESRRQWEFSAADGNKSDELPSYKQFQEFLTKRYRALEFLDSRPNSGPKGQVHKFKSMHISDVQCELCSEGHALVNCPEFNKKAVEWRRNFVKTKNLCFSCLGANHFYKTCKKNWRCRVCSKRHHSLLHSDASSSHAAQVTESAASSEDIEETTDNVDAVISCFAHKECPALLPTALVNTVAENGQNFTARAFLDQGSQPCFITEAMVQLLGLKKTLVKAEVSVLGGHKITESKATVNVKITSKVNPEVTIVFKAHVMKSITSLLPTTKIKKFEDWKELNNLVLADPEFRTPNTIDILLGSKIYGKVLQDGIIKGPQGWPLAQCTTLGWIISGEHENSNDEAEIKVMHITEDNNFLKKFWELEDDIPMSREKLYNEEEKRCEALFAATTLRDEDGRYVVQLPLKVDKPVVENSLKIAEQRFMGLESRLKTGDLKKKYTDVINEYVELNHMELVPEEDINNPVAIYLPHHAVVRDDKQTTKVRAVFDASCKGSNNKSLNDQLLVGPTLQPELRHLVMQWRMSRICLTADIVKMYRQIKMNPSDVDYHRILWRANPSDEIKHYRMLRVTFGVASAPYLAVKALQQLKVDEGHNYPVAAEAVLQRFYMDDLLAGCDTVEEGINLYRELNDLVEKGGFSLQKWSSNSEELLQEMKKRENEHTTGEEIDELKIKTDEIQKIVGLTWNRSDDSFRYKVDAPEVLEPATKRTIISEICRFYDPLGWASPSIILSKILIQRLWLTGITWDEIVPDYILREWKCFKQELKMLTHIQIPRWTGQLVGDSVELHGFSDASKDAYAAVIYARVIDSAGIVHVSLISAKTKVAPIKQVSIPRLELCAAVLLTRLLTEVAAIMNIDKTKLHAWTDSTVVLAWLNSHPNRWKVFVANRVSEILQNLDSHHWAHVPTKNNPADVASRGQPPSDLVKNTMWFNGPEFLYNDCINYSKPKGIGTNEEETRTKTCCAVISEDQILEKFSSFMHMQRVIAYCKRFIRNTKGEKSERVVGALSAAELNDAVIWSIRHSQAKHFEEEIQKIKHGENLPKKSSLRSLNPFLDADGVLRVGGRLENADLPMKRRHPILIPKEGHLTYLLVYDAHKQTLHGGPQLMISYLRNKYWIMGASRLVKQCFRKCVTCVKHSGKTQTQLMGQLPSQRSTPARPFKISGVDYAGPIQIRTTKGRGHQSHKGYIALFVCMSSKAVHLEVVTSLTTEAYIQAFKRFTSRRGYCSELWSDNGTNFTGAASELKKLFKNEKGSMVQEIAEVLATNGCSWNFIPARAPHFGGLWEAAVKSVKYHLKRVIGQSTLTFEEMSTVLAQIEACLNSRPLTSITSIDEDFIVLTPGHFLIGEPLVIPPDRNYEDANVNSLRRWQYTQKMIQDFWRQWSKQYLNKFYKRYKWSSTEPQPRIGDIVVIREENLPPCRWLYGKVVDMHPGRDSLVRVVTLRVKSGLIQRAINKICLLPIERT